MRFLSFVFILAAFAGCSPKSGSGTATVSFKVPTAAEFSAASKATAILASDMTAANACFMVNVTASDIQLTSPNDACDLPTGVFFGSVPPGTSSSIQLQVPFGDSRKFQVFAYFRHSAAETCGTFKTIAEYDRSRVGLLGTLDNVSIQKEAVSLDMTISMPTQTIAKQFNLPVTCQTTVQSGPFGRTIAGSTIATTASGNYKVRTSVGGSEKNYSVTQSGFHVWRKRGAAQ